MSLIKEEKPQPVQHFNMHDDPLTNIETLHILIWEQGLCVAGYGLNGNVLTTKVYLFPKGNIHAVESIFINEPLVAGPQPVTHIWVAEERNMVVPAHLFQEQAAATWLARFHAVSPDETVLTCTVKQPAAVGIAYPVATALLTIMGKYFAEAKVAPFSAVLLQQETTAEQDTADIVFLKDTVTVTIRKKGKLISHQTGTMEDVQDLVYKIASISQDHGIAQDELKVAISGCCIAEHTTNELKAYYPKMTIPGTEQFSSFTLLSKLISCAS